MIKILEKINLLTGSTYDLSKSAIFLAVFLFLINVFLIDFEKIVGDSMLPSLKSGQFVLFNKSVVYEGKISRGAIVALRFPGDPEKVKYIKRIIGLPGEQVRISGSAVFINNQLLVEPYLISDVAKAEKFWQLGEEEFFVLGDNRANSNDSRVFGPVEKRFINGQAKLVVWPSADFQIISLPTN